MISSMPYTNNSFAKPNAHIIEVGAAIATAPGSLVPESHPAPFSASPSPDTPTENGAFYIQRSIIRSHLHYDRRRNCTRGMGREGSRPTKLPELGSVASWRQ